MILMNDFKAEPAALREAMAAAAARVFASGWYILGQELKAFEETWARVCGTAHCVGVGNGLDAIELALRALDIGPGDEVITTPMTAVATVLAIVRAGAHPVLADIDPGTALLSPDSVRRCIGPRTRAVLLVHLYGQVRDMDAWTALTAENGLQLIEDCAQSHLACWRGAVAGSFGVAGAYSFYPTKNLGGIGDGGAVVTDDDDLAALLRELRNHARGADYDHPHVTGNSRLSEVEAAALRVGLRRLAADNARRREVAAAYRAAAPDLAWHPEHPRHVYHLCVARLADREAYRAGRPFDTAIHYARALTQQSGYSGFVRDACPEAEAWAAETVSFPCFPEITDDEIEAVCRGLL